MVENKDLSVLEENDGAAYAAPVSDVEEEESLIVKFKKPYTFERKEYTEIDLSGMEDLTGADMIRIEKRYNRNNAGINVMPEVSEEYAILFAAEASGQPVEFFEHLPGREVIKVKNRVMSFLFGSE